MVFGGLISILIAIWIYRTAIEAKTGNTFYWVVGSVLIYLVVQVSMIYFNSIVIDIVDGDISSEFDSGSGLKVSANSDTAGMQSGGSLIGIVFEFLPLAVPFFVVAVLRLLVMLRQPFSFPALFGGIKEMFISIKDSFVSSSHS